MNLVHRQPDFENILSVLRCEVPKRPTLFEFIMNGNDIMDDIIQDMKFDGKQSYEDNILCAEESYEKQGGIDVYFLIRSPKEEIAKKAKRMLDLAKENGGYAFGLGNSIPDYIPNEKYFAMTSATAE